MMTKQWQSMHKHDSYYKQAKAQGYRSRAAFKLKQINNKFKIIRSGDLVLDLGAAPGGWSQVAAELAGKDGKIIGIDLQAISKLNNAIFLIGDITDPHVIELISEHKNDAEINVVISDAAPNISGNYTMDQARSVYLAECSLKIVKQLLKSGGNFVVKVFEGEDFKQFYEKVKNNFQYIKIYSPKASRARSSEVYVIAKGFQRSN
jgi:23S rRNA (uridine2552-2'-O)-methyltransferase